MSDEPSSPTLEQAASPEERDLGDFIDDVIARTLRHRESDQGQLRSRHGEWLSSRQPFEEEFRRLAATLASETRGRPGAGDPPATVTGPSLPAHGQPSRFLAAFLEERARGPRLVPSGLPQLDRRLGGGFDRGVHLIAGPPAAGKSALLEAIAWEAVLSGRPVVYYSLREGGRGVWERLVSTLSRVVDDHPTLTLADLRARDIEANQLPSLTLIDRCLQRFVLPFLTLLDASPDGAGGLDGFLCDVRTRFRRLEERLAVIPLLLVDDLQRLTALAGETDPHEVATRLGETLRRISAPGLVTTTSAGAPVSGTETHLALTPGSTAPDGMLSLISLRVHTNRRTGWLGTLPLVFDRGSGIFASVEPD